jgi:hypothetical protein
MDYAAASYDSSQSKWAPPVLEPVYHFQHIAAWKAEQRKKTLAKLSNRR